MSQIKEAIRLLSSVFESAGFTKCKAESFRLAKFNNDEVVQHFWTLLYEILMYLENRGNITEVQFHKKHPSSDVIVAQTKRKMQTKGYLSVEFANLPDDMSTGSRELLLAFGWLLSTQRVLDMILEYLISPLDLPLPYVDKETIGDLGSTKARLTTEQKIKRLQLINGKLHLSLKQLYALHRTKKRLQHKIHTSTKEVNICPGREHLSVLETHILRHPDQLKIVIQLLDKENDMLNSMLLWREHEHVFWKWMESVLLLKKEETEEDKTEDQRFIHYNIQPELLIRLATTQKKLESSILRSESVIGQLEELWNVKQKEVNRLDIQHLAKAVDAELGFVKENMLVPKHKQNKGLNTKEACFIFSKPAQKKGNVFIPELHTADYDQGREPIDIDTEIASLQSHILRLQLELHWKERYYQQKLDQLSANIPNAVCIQPSHVTVKQK